MDTTRRKSEGLGKRKIATGKRKRRTESTICVTTIRLCAAREAQAEPTAP